MFKIIFACNFSSMPPSAPPLPHLPEKHDSASLTGDMWLTESMYQHDFMDADKHGLFSSWKSSTERQTYHYAGSSLLKTQQGHFLSFTPSCVFSSACNFIITQYMICQQAFQGSLVYLDEIHVYEEKWNALGRNLFSMALFPEHN